MRAGLSAIIRWNDANSRVTIGAPRGSCPGVIAIVASRHVILPVGATVILTIVTIIVLKTIVIIVVVVVVVVPIQAFCSPGS